MSKVVSIVATRAADKAVPSVTLQYLVNMLSDTAGTQYCSHIVNDIIQGELKVDDTFLGIIKEGNVPDAEVLLKMYLLGVIHAKKGV